MLKFFRFTTAVLIILSVGLAGYIFAITKNLPRPELFDQRQVSQSTKIYDRTGEILLYEIHGEEKRTIIPFEKIPEHVKQATLAIEDSEFYNHSAFDWRSLARAFFVNVTRGRVVQGGSTITQQLAKNAFLTPERTLTRKIKELILAFQLEKKYIKDEIFGLYLNQIPYGSNAYGIEAAAQTFFQKQAADLTVAEAALLASLPKAPSYYSPYGSHVDELTARKNYVLSQLTLNGFLDEDEDNRAKQQEIKFSPQATNIKAPHFVITVQEYLNNKYGEDFVQKAGLRVISTLDWELQQLAEKVIAEGAERNANLYKGRNAALVAQDSKTGQVLALVGSRDYFNIENDGNFNVATQGLRQPGSAIKPFAYVTAFQNGFTPDTIVFDVETNFDTSGKKDYRPRNFDNRFRGPVTFRQALAQSINVPSVKVLYLAGVNNVLDTVEKFGITSLTERSRYGLSLALGGGEVKLIELVGAYSVFSRDGVKHKQHFVLEIRDFQNNLLEKYQDEFEEVIDPQYARLINDILSDAETRKALYQNSFHLTVFPGQEVALKTGTTNEYHDAWSLGYTPSLTVGVWVGNNDNQPMQQQGSSILAALPIWNAFVLEALKNKPLEVFVRPDLVVADKPILNGQYLINNEIHNLLYYINRRSPRGAAPINPAKDPQFNKWEAALIEWLQNNRIDANNLVLVDKLTIVINSPVNGAFIVNNKLDINAQIRSLLDVVKIEVYLNDVLISQKSGNLSQNFTYIESFNISQLNLQNVLKIKAADVSGKEAEKKIIIYLKR